MMVPERLENVKEARYLDEEANEIVDDDNFDDLLQSNDPHQNQTTSNTVSEECIKILGEDDSPPTFGFPLTDAVQKKFQKALLIT
ncbi:unnamed protein product [Orchesella dallaii]|uniref:Uncharacterized protein n=1 Tax=Orchesella dallaii TaxID=48710 RepID=A0ABP1RUF8_9HEXA